MKKGYRFFMGTEELPVTPSRIFIKINNQNKKLMLINDGEINILKSAGLTDIEFSVLIPNKRYPFARYSNGFRGAQYFLDLFEKLKNSRAPFYFRVLRESLNPHTSMKVSLEEYAIIEEAENSSDYVIDIKLKQFKDYGTQVLTYNQNTGVAVAGNNKRTLTLTREEGGNISPYTIKSDDTLYKIAKMMLGDGARQNEIYEFNKNVLDRVAESYGKSNIPGKVYLYPGTVILIKKG